MKSKVGYRAKSNLGSMVKYLQDALKYNAFAIAEQPDTLVLVV